jgi:hypothetical protein
MPFISPERIHLVDAEYKVGDKVYFVDLFEIKEHWMCGCDGWYLFFNHQKGRRYFDHEFFFTDMKVEDMSQDEISKHVIELCTAGKKPRRSKMPYQPDEDFTEKDWHND